MNSKIVRIAFLSALLIVSKEILSFIPNVELVTVLLMAYTYSLKRSESLYIVFIFTITQALLYPPHLWIITYLVVWSILVIITDYLKRRNASLLVLSIWAAIFGLSFGFVDSIIQSFVYGFHTFKVLWIRGLPWDFIHAISNYLTVLILFKPIVKTLNKALKIKDSE